VPLGEEIPLERGHQRGVPPPPRRNRYFTTIGSSSVKTVADRHRLAAYQPTSFPVVPTSMTLNDLEPKNRGFSEFLAILGCNTHFKNELHRNLRMKCPALNVDFKDVRFEPLPLGSRSRPYERIKFGYPLENVRFLLLPTNLAREQ